MALDGIVIANLVHEFNETLLMGRLTKIAQPEPDELILTIKNNRSLYKLQLSAGASLPLAFLTSQSKTNPMTAPNFCMLLRKYINNGKIIRIYQPEFERIIHFEIEHYDEMGDLCKKQLIIELMGKHSNIIFCQENGTIIDSIKHVSALMSSVREVLPGRKYFIPFEGQKENPLTITEDTFTKQVFQKKCNLAKALYTTLTGISPMIAEEICTLASLDSALPCDAFFESEKKHLYHTFSHFMEDVSLSNFTPMIFYKEDEPVEYASLPLSIYNAYRHSSFSSISALLELYYSQKEQITRIRQKSSDLRLVIQNALNKDYRKYDLQSKQLKDTGKREKFKVYGELLTSYAYDIPNGSSEYTAWNYYTNTELKIPLDASIPPIENAKKYFEKYNKMKRTYEALTGIIQETKEEIEHLESIRTALDIALEEEDLVEIKEELMAYGYIRRKYGKKKEKVISKPFHYLSSDGYHMYVGKNNFQNEELTFKLATGNDWWFHAKGIPGSHVIVKSGGDELPNSTFEEAGQLAAYYSKGKEQEKVEIDYIQKKHVKKAAGGKPGFVIYHTNYSLMARPDISNIKKAST